jgi:hypothetical protein
MRYLSGQPVTHDGRRSRSWWATETDPGDAIARRHSARFLALDGLSLRLDGRTTPGTTSEALGALAVAALTGRFAPRLHLRGAPAGRVSLRHIFSLRGAPAGRVSLRHIFSLRGAPAGRVSHRSNRGRADDHASASRPHGSLRSPFGQPWRSLLTSDPGTVPHEFGTAHRSRHARLALPVRQEVDRFGGETGSCLGFRIRAVGGQGLVADQVPSEDSSCGSSTSS